MRAICSVVLAIFVTLTTACESTTRLASRNDRGASSSGAAGEAGVTGDDAGAVDTTVPAGAAASRPGAISASGTARAGAVSGSTGGATRGPDASLAMGRGVTSSEIKIGVFIGKNIQQAVGAVTGRSDSGGAEEQKISDALVAYVNSHGGLRGRKLVPTYAYFDPLGSQPWPQQEQVACSQFVEDARVFAILGGTQSGKDAIVACAAKAQTPLVTETLWPVDSKYFNDANGWLFAPSRMRAERWVPAWVDGLREAGYFSAGAKLGFVRFDEPVFARQADLLKRTLGQRGLSLASEYVVKTPSQGSDLGGESAELGNAIVRFRAVGVDHVVFGEWSSQMPTFFLQQAEGQGYRPRYGFNSNDLLDTVAGLAPDAQVADSVGVSWMPAADASPASDPRKDPANEMCKKIMIDSGNVPYSALYASSLCDAFFFLQTALQRANALTPAAFAPAAASVGTFDTPFAFGSTMGPGKSDGANIVRNMKWSTPCKCFAYVGSSKTVP